MSDWDILQQDNLSDAQRQRVVYKAYNNRRRPAPKTCVKIINGLNVVSKKNYKVNDIFFI